ncbi:hypothetical protein [Spirosoma oryzae]|nr:hypothetical protein [Spirosoma oryzae]
MSATANETTIEPASLGELFQKLVDLAVPGVSHYQAHQLRTDGVYRVVVRAANGFQTLSIPAQALLLAELGMLVESDRYAIMQQLKVADNRTVVA